MSMELFLRYILAVPLRESGLTAAWRILANFLLLCIGLKSFVWLAVGYVLYRLTLPAIRKVDPWPWK